MELPLILINFKAYEEATGEKALKLANICKEVSERYKVTVGICPQDVDIYRISSKVRIPIFAQSIEPIEPDSHTGHELPLAAKEAGAIGSLINHSENRLKLPDIEKCVLIAKKLGLITVCCAPGVRLAKEIARFSPDFIAVEPPELIGTGIPVSKAKPEVVVNSVKAVHSVNKKIKVLCGAGISNGDDAKKALELGTVGVLVASAVVKASSPKAVLVDLVKGVKACNAQ